MKSLTAGLTQTQQDLDEMFREVNGMLKCVTERLHAISPAADHQELFQSLAAKDAVIDALDVKIEQRCLTLLALQQPVATDLRKIIAISRIIVDLERIGDICVNISKRLRALSSNRSFEVPPLIIEMAERATQMLSRATSAYRESDTHEAERIRAEDNIVDSMLRESIDGIVDRMYQEKSDLDALLNLFSITRQFERIADHTSGISEEIIFLVDGRIIRHEGTIPEE